MKAGGKNGKNKDAKKGKGGQGGDNDDEQKLNDSNNASSTGKGGKDNKKNPVSALSAFKTVLPRYFSSEWSLAQFRVPDVRTIVAFGSDETTIVVVSSDGTFYKAKFDPQNGGDCQKLKDEQFLKSNDDYNYSTNQ